MTDHYVWLIWSSAFLIPWLGLYLVVPARRRLMLRASLLTMPFGLTEPLFVPAYWSPPSLFELARRTRFDLESLIFSFAIGGVGLVLYDALIRGVTVRLPVAEQHHTRHRLHRLALVAPVLSFPPLLLLDWNPIYPAIVAMGTGAVAAIACRPDLKARASVGAILFLTFYTVLLLGLEVTAPGYIARVWNLPALSGLLIAGLPLEELLFAAAFGAYWSAVYEHLTWSTSSTAASSANAVAHGSRVRPRANSAAFLRAAHRALSALRPLWPRGPRERRPILTARRTSVSSSIYAVFAHQRRATRGSASGVSDSPQCGRS